MPSPSFYHLRRWFLLLALLANLPFALAAPRKKGSFVIEPLPSPSQPLSSGGRVVALVIGINYQGTKFSPLLFAEKDAQAFASFLRSQGVTVHLLAGRKATLATVRSTISHLWRQIRPKTDGVLVYFSGHGEKVNGKHLLVLADSDPEALDETGLDWDFLKRKLDQTRSRRQILILDACYGSAFTRSSFLAQLEDGEKKKFLLRSSSFLPGEIQRAFRAQGRISFFSSQAGQPSIEPSSLGHGLYTYYLLQGLKGAADTNGDRCITADELHTYLLDKVYSHAKSLGKQQTPHWSGSKELAEGFEGRDMLLLRLPGCGSSPSKPPASPTPPHTASGRLELRVQTSNVKVYQDGALRRILRLARTPYTLSFPPGRYTLLFKKSGYSDLSETIVIVPNELLSLDIELQRLTHPERPATPSSPAAPTAERPAEPAPIITAVPPSPATPKAGDRQTFQAKGVTFAMRFIPAGTFVMGSPADEKQRDSDEGPQRRVRLSRAFWMLETEVTQGQYKALVGSNPSHFSSCGDTCPVEQVSWHEAAVFANTLSTQQNLPSCFTCKANGECDIPDKAAYLACKGWRLPTEAEWEYAARAGTTSRFHTGNCITPDQANFGGNYPPEGCPGGEYREKTVAVGSFAANAWGLHDMHGNVLEWVADWYKETYDSNDLGDPLQLLGSDPRRRSDRVIRGGSWYGYGWGLRSARRLRYGPAERDDSLGFRLSRSR